MKGELVLQNQKKGAVSHGTKGRILDQRRRETGLKVDLILPPLGAWNLFVCSPRYLGRNMACRHPVLGANLTGFLEVARGTRTKLLIFGT